MNQRIPFWSKTAVLRLTLGPGSSNTDMVPVAGSTRTSALSPLSVSHGDPSGPTMTPWGAEFRAQRDLGNGAGRRIESAERAVSLPAVPDGPIPGRSHIVRAAAGRHRVFDNIGDGSRPGAVVVEGRTGKRWLWSKSMKSSVVVVGGSSTDVGGGLVPGASRQHQECHPSTHPTHRTFENRLTVALARSRSHTGHDWGSIHRRRRSLHPDRGHPGWLDR